MSGTQLNCDVTALEVGAGKMQSCDEMSLVFFFATGCLVSNLAGKNPESDPWVRNCSSLSVGSFSLSFFLSFFLSFVTGQAFISITG